MRKNNGFIILVLDYTKSTQIAKKLDEKQTLIYYQEIMNLLSSVIQDYGGGIWNYTGDGFLAAFSTESLNNYDFTFECATRLVAISKKILKDILKARGIDNFAVKVAIDVGELTPISLRPQAGVIVANYVGEVVNRVCRICSVAKSNGITIGKAFYKLLYYSNQDRFVLTENRAKDYRKYPLYEIKD